MTTTATPAAAPPPGSPLPDATGTESASTPAHEGVPAPRAGRPGGRVGAWAPRLATCVVIAGVIAVVLWQMHLPLLLSDTTTTGGDTGAHYMMPAFFDTNLFPHLTGWNPYWYDGYPAYTFYFVLPDVLVAIASHVISYDVAFKLATVMGSLLLPVAAWALGRLFGMRPPVPAALAAVTLPFLFDYTWTIYGGNLFSTLAGEYSYSLSVAFLVLFLGLFARGLRTGRHRVWAALALAACILAHIVPGALALAGAAVLTLFELLPARLRLRDDDELPWALEDAEALAAVGVTRAGDVTLQRDATKRGADARTPAPARSRSAVLGWAASTVGIGVALAAWWLVPFLVRQNYSTSMNYTKVTTYASIFFPKADLWVLVIAAVGLVVAIARRSRLGLLLAVLGGLSAAAVVLDPTRSLYNVRFLPLWFLCVYLLAGWVFAVGVGALARAVRRERLVRWVIDRRTLDAEPIGSGHAQNPGTDDRERAGRVGGSRPPVVAPWAAGAVGGALLALVGALVVVVPPFVPAASATLDSLGIHPGANQVTVWSEWNYTGYEGKTDYPEYHALMALMRHVGNRYGCGRAMWEYNSDENRFGTPEALMLLPYWTTGCIDSMEGLLFESSATTPYHFLNQAELSQSPSEAVVGLPYGPLTVPLGVDHLQLLGVRYFMAASPQVEEEADVDPTLHLVATSGPWDTTFDGEHLSTTWKVYVVERSSVVEPLADEPAVLTGVGQGQTTWLGRIGTGDSMSDGPSLRWYLDPAAWPVELVAGGPSTWPRIKAASATRPPARRLTPTKVSDVHQRATSISFTVSQVGKPVLVKISYFPNWHATGAKGPWRATPNLMVVVPTSHHVTLYYGTTPVTQAGDALTVLGLVAVVACTVGWLVRRRRAAPVG